ncbi:MAG: HEAT repeat domain-containing protein [Myxococcaceae bacterium]|jgi:HEAT repeat protein|nr:HEAT repeat domain-containing protein [Myxococcaceae bacterium]
MKGTRTSPRPLDADARRAALEAVVGEDKAEIIRAARLLSGDSSTTESLLEVLPNEQRPPNRQAVLYALAWHGDTRTWPVAMTILDDATEHPSVRGQAAEVLSYLFLRFEPGEAHFEDAIRVLLRTMTDPSPEVRYCVANTLGSTGFLPMCKHLEGMLNDHAVAEGWVGTVADEAARAIEDCREMAEQRVRRRLNRP